MVTEGNCAIFEIYFSQLFERIKVYVAPFWKPHAKVFPKYKGYKHPCSLHGTFFRLKIKTLQIDHFRLFWILKSLLNRQIMKIGHKT